MVDNENNQWEEIEYEKDEVNEEETESYDEEDPYNDEESDEEEGDEEEEYEEYDEDGDDEAPKKKSALPLVILLAVLLLAGGLIAVPKLMNKDNTANTYNNTQNVQTKQSQEDMAASFFDAAGGNESDMMSVNFNDDGESTDVLPTSANDQGQEFGQEQVATVKEAEPGEGINENDLFADQANQENDSIMVVYNKASRLNPFKPPIIVEQKDTPFETINNTQFEIIEPPTASVPDENLTKLLQTQISGIMYDSESPAAIVNLNGIDQFVKIGDVVSGYKIENITKDKVQINYKNNSYVASVGELFSKGNLELKPAVANLENKFAGRYKDKQ